MTMKQQLKNNDPTCLPTEDYSNGLLLGDYSSSDIGFILRYADCSNTNDIIPCKHAVSVHKRELGDWALIELSRQGLSKEENIRLNRRIFETVKGRNVRTAFAVGHWDDAAYPYRAERFLAVRRLDDMPIAEFKMLVSECVTADQKGQTHAVVHLGSQTKDAIAFAASRHSGISRNIYKYGNHLVRPDGIWQACDETGFADVYAREIRQAACRFAFDGIEHPVCDETKEMFAALGISLPDFSL